jgi:aquaporin Z
LFYIIASGKRIILGGFAANGLRNIPRRVYAAALFVTVTFVFLMVILGSTDKRAPQGFAPIAIGLALTLIHLISIPVTNTSVNPARSTSQALFVKGWALYQLWLFWVAPILGAIIAGLTYRGLFEREKS